MIREEIEGNMIQAQLQKDEAMTVEDDDEGP